MSLLGAVTLCLSLICFSSNSLLAQKSDSISVYVFLSETCPICQSVTIELKSLYSTYRDKGVSFTGLFPNQTMSTEETRRKFEKKYSIPFFLTFDKNQQMANKLAATTTPQVFVLRNSDNKVLYKGKIDNSFVSIGKRKQVVDEHYLRDALENIIQNKPANPAQTDPVGCYISRN